MSEEYMIMTGNDACVRGAIAAGMNFFAGYPITPASEMAELASVLLPQQGGKFMQMEDELASVGALIGASLAGGKAMTATSGPGFSLMQENLGLAASLEVPCVVADVMRQGPAQGVATVPAQGDIMQIRWGTHGDRAVIAVAPCSVPEMYTETIRAFNMSEKYRMPVIVMSDATLAHLSEKVRIPKASEIEVVNRKRPTCAPADYKPFEDDGTGIPPLAVFGDGYQWITTSLMHDETGFPVTNKPELTASVLRRQHNKVERNVDDIVRCEEYRCEDAQVVIVSIGLVSRSVREAVDELRAEGKRVGLFRPITVWPFPAKQLQSVAKKADTVLVCEMNEGQMSMIVGDAVRGAANVVSRTQNNGKVIDAATVKKWIEEVL